MKECGLWLVNHVLVDGLTLMIAWTLQTVSNKTNKQANKKKGYKRVEVWSEPGKSKEEQ